MLLRIFILLGLSVLHGIRVKKRSDARQRSLGRVDRKQGMNASWPGGMSPVNSGGGMSPVKSDTSPMMSKLRMMSRKFTKSILGLVSPSKPAIIAPQGAEFIFHWVQLFLYSRLAETDRGEAVVLWDKDKAETLERPLGFPEKQLEVRFISGAAGKIYEYSTRTTWTDLDVWMSHISFLKTHEWIVKHEKQINRMQIDPAWITSKDTKKLTTWTEFRKRAERWVQDGDPIAQDALENFKEVDAWEPHEETSKLITDFLFTYWKGTDVPVSLREKDTSKIFKLSIAGPPEQLAFKIAMFSGARQKNVTSDETALDPFRLELNGNEGDPLIFKVTDTYDITYIFVKLVERQEWQLYNDFVKHVMGCVHSKKQGNDAEWIRHDAKRTSKFNGNSVFALWMKLYEKWDQPMWFQKSGDESKHKKLPVDMLNLFVNKAALKLMGIADDRHEGLLRYSFGENLKIVPQQQVLQSLVFWPCEDHKIKFITPRSKLLHAGFAEVPLAYSLQHDGIDVEDFMPGDTIDWRWGNGGMLGWQGQKTLQGTIAYMSKPKYSDEPKYSDRPVVVWRKRGTFEKTFNTLRAAKTEIVIAQDKASHAEKKDHAPVKLNAAVQQMQSNPDREDMLRELKSAIEEAKSLGISTSEADELVREAEVALNVAPD